MMRLTRITALFLIILSLWALGRPGWTDEPAKVAIVPFKMNADRDLSFLQQGIVDMLATRLSWRNKVTVIPKETTEQALSGMTGSVDEEGAKQLGTTLGADYVLFGSLTIFGESVSIDAKIIDVDGSEPPVTAFTQSQGMDTVIPKVDAFAADINQKIFGRGQPVQVAAPSQAPSEAPSKDIYAHPEKMFSQGTEKPVVSGTPTSELNPDFVVAEGHKRSAGFWKSKNFEENLKAISIGDVDGDGKQEIAFVSLNKLFVYRNADRQFARVAEVPGTANDNFIGVDVADMNGNGKAEVFVTSLNAKRKKLASLVLEWDGDAFVTVAEKQPWYFRVMELPAKGDVLVGQRRGVVEPFTGDIHELGWINGQYEPLNTLEVPRDLNVFAFALGDVQNNGSEMIVAFNENDRLQILTATGTREWKSSEHYGGSESFLVLEPARVEDDVGTEADIGRERLYLPQRIFLKDLNRDGKQEVLTVKNYAMSGRLFGRFRHYGSGEIVSLSWDGLGLGLNWKTRKIERYVSDFGIADFDNDNEPEIVVAVVISRGATLVKKAKSAIISYDLAMPKAAEAAEEEAG